MRWLYILKDLSGKMDNHYYLDKETAQKQANYLNKEQNIQPQYINDMGFIVETVELNTQAKCMNCPNLASDKDSICLSCYHK